MNVYIQTDIEGDDFMDVLNRAIRAFPWSPQRGAQKLDAYSYPNNVIP